MTDTKNKLVKEAFLAHYGVQGMKWGVRRYQNKDGTRTAAGKKHDQLVRKTGNAMKTTKDANDIVDTLTKREKELLGAPLHEKWIAEKSNTGSNALAKKYGFQEADPYKHGWAKGSFDGYNYYIYKKT